ncbi:MAG TPA: hypothetical protein VMG10_13295 [Gemmataceae bacterium]|nr:hypothetical protein [Gemmataceae bacterium]
MRPKTSVRQPIIAGARREHLSDLLRKWRRQPRKRSLLLFWGLLSLALTSDTSLLVLGARLFCKAESMAPPADRHIHVPYAADASLWEPLRHWIVRADGRTQLFESFSRKAVREITGEEWFEGRNPLAVVVSWMLDSDARSLKWDDYPCLRCEDAELRAVLYREECNPSRMSREEQLHGRYVEPSMVSSSRSLAAILRCIKAKGGVEGAIPLSSLERHAVDLKDRLTRFEEIRRGGVDGGDSAEMQTPSGALREAYLTDSKDLFAAALHMFLDASRRAMRVEENPKAARRLACEAWLNDYTPSWKAMYLSILGTGLFTAAAIARIRWPRWRRRLLLSGVVACLGCLGWTLAAIVCWAIREGTLPLSDGTHDILWTAFLVMGLGLCLALLKRDAFVSWTGALVASGGLLVANYWPKSLADHWPLLPKSAAGDSGLLVQGLLLLSAYAALALAWAVAAFTLGRTLVASPTAERLRRLAALCLGTLRIGSALLIASALLDGCRVMTAGSCSHEWNAQAVGALFVLPTCGVLAYASRRGWIQPFAFMVSVAISFTLLATLRHTAILPDAGNQAIGTLLSAEGGFCAATILNLSLAAHAALRFYFGKQPILEA